MRSKKFFKINWWARASEGLALNNAIHAWLHNTVNVSTGPGMLAYR